MEIVRFPEPQKVYSLEAKPSLRRVVKEQFDVACLARASPGWQKG
jgi:hypothetical protein